ncbi:hypothetical protein V8F06_003787 [Rhypophila decipiens]
MNERMAGIQPSGMLPHRSVANIKSPPPLGAGSGPGGSGPTTPTRPIISTFASPSSLRAEEDVIIVEFGTRKVQVGFAGDAAPRGTVWFGPELQRRVGDFREWQPGYVPDWRKSASGGLWGAEYELWCNEVRGQDMGLVRDRVERALREAFTKYLLIDSRPRRMVCVLPSDLPIPLLSAVLDSVFTRFQPPTVSLLSPTVSLAVAAGVRSALVVDLGWNETVVTGVYEYREVYRARSIRGGRKLTEQTHDFLARHIPQTEEKEKAESAQSVPREHVLSFEECNGIANRLVWCKPASLGMSMAELGEGLPTVQEHEESDEESENATRKTRAVVDITLTSPQQAVSFQLPFESLAEPCETAFFDSRYSACSFDDEELPIHLLVYQSLLKLPLDVRSICMSRIIFTGGGANVLGLRQRIFDEVSHLVQTRGWDPVTGKGVDQLRSNPKLKKRGTRQAGNGPVGVQQQNGGEQDGVWHDAANVTHESDPIEEQLKKGTDKRPRVEGELRAIESVGTWSGASLMTHLKIAAVATIDRELWLQHGVLGACKPGDVDSKAHQRQSIGAGGLMRGAGGSSSWTLGVWGTT